MDKIDARKLSAHSRATLRKRVVRLRKQSQMTVKALAAVAGVHYRTVEGWLARARREGEASLDKERKRGRPVGACRKLALADELWLREQIVGQTPQRLCLPYALWTRPAIRALIKARFGIELQDRLLGKYLQRWGFTPQRPIKRALEQDPVKVKTWLQDVWPQLRARARTEGATILWGDETAVEADANWVRGDTLDGRAPVLKIPTRRGKLSMLSAISARGEVAFQIVEGAINTDRFIAFLALLLQQVPGKIFLVVANLRVQHARKLTAWLADKQNRIELVFLPPFALPPPHPRPTRTCRFEPGFQDRPA